MTSRLNYFWRSNCHYVKLFYNTIFIIVIPKRFLKASEIFEIGSKYIWFDIFSFPADLTSIGLKLDSAENSGDLPGRRPLIFMIRVLNS